MNVLVLNYHHPTRSYNNNRVKRGDYCGSLVMAMIYILDFMFFKGQTNIREAVLVFDYLQIFEYSNI